MLYAGISDRGNVRSNNEDSSFVPTKYAHADHGFFLAVADGMGGHSAGEVASKMAIKSMLALLEKPGMHERATEKPDWFLDTAIQEANNKIHLLSTESHKLAGMGTTVTAALLFQEKIVVGHIGDSRAYLLENAGISRITKDHTLLEELIDSGALKGADTKNFSQRHVLTRALGVKKDTKADVSEVPWQEGDILLLCSDGLTEHVEEIEIQEILDEYQDDIERSSVVLCDLALARGGQDNITICIAFHDGIEGRSM